MSSAKASFSSKWWYIILGIFCLAIFVGFSYLVHRNLFLHLDFDTTVRLQEHISRRFDILFSFFSDIGKFEIVTIFLVSICLIYRKLKTFLAIVLYGAMHLLEIYGKAFVAHLPPPHFLLRTHDVFTFPQFYVQQTNSYPSGHAGRALFLTAFLGIITHRTRDISRAQKMFIYSGIAIYDLTMLVSRIYLGEHWLSDVIGGSILGAAFGFLAGIFV